MSKTIYEAEREMAEVYVRGDLKMDPETAQMHVEGVGDVPVVTIVQGAMRLWRKTLQIKALKRARTHRDAYFSDLDAAIEDVKPEFSRDGSHHRGVEAVRQAAKEHTRVKYGE